MFYAAVVAAVGVIWAKLIRPLIRFGQRVERTMTRVEYELGTNGGGTMRDQVNRIAEEQTRQSARLDTLEKSMAYGNQSLQSHLSNPQPQQEAS